MGPNGSLGLELVSVANLHQDSNDFLSQVDNLSSRFVLLPQILKESLENLIETSDLERKYKTHPSNVTQTSPNFHPATILQIQNATSPLQRATQPLHNFHLAKTAEPVSHPFKQKLYVYFQCIGRRSCISLVLKP
jgi:DNA repair ATPase RecN